MDPAMMTIGLIVSLVMDPAGEADGGAGARHAGPCGRCQLWAAPSPSHTDPGQAAGEEELPDPPHHPGQRAQQGASP